MARECTCHHTDQNDINCLTIYCKVISLKDIDTAAWLIYLDDLVVVKEYEVHKVNKGDHGPIGKKGPRGLPGENGKPSIVDFTLWLPKTLLKNLNKIM